MAHGLLGGNSLLSECPHTCRSFPKLYSLNSQSSNLSGRKDQNRACGRGRGKVLQSLSFQSGQYSSFDLAETVQHVSAELDTSAQGLVDPPTYIDAPGRVVASRSSLLFNGEVLPSCHCLLAKEGLIKSVKNFISTRLRLKASPGLRSMLTLLCSSRDAIVCFCRLIARDCSASSPILCSRAPDCPHIVQSASEMCSDWIESRALKLTSSYNQCNTLTINADADTSNWFCIVSATVLCCSWRYPWRHSENLSSISFSRSSERGHR